MALGKEFSKKKEKILCRVPLRWHSAKRPSELTSDFFLPSANVTLGKETFVDGFFADYSLPSVALGKSRFPRSVWPEAQLYDIKVVLPY